MLRKNREVDTENNIIYIASHNLIFQIYKFLGYIFIFLCLFKSNIKFIKPYFYKFNIYNFTQLHFQF